MAEIKKSALFKKLSPQAYDAFEEGVRTCKGAGNPYVELIHWLDEMLRRPSMDIPPIFGHFKVSAEAIILDFGNALKELPKGARAISDFSPEIFKALQQGFLWSGIFFDASRIRSGHLLVGMLKDDELCRRLYRLSPELKKIDADQLADEFVKIVEGSAERSSAPGSMGTELPGQQSGAVGGAEMGKQEALRRFTTDLTEKARQGKLDPIVGRDEEIGQCIDILMRRRQNNPILVGEAGVGKTAVVEGFAQRVVSGEVPAAFKEVSVRVLDIGLLQAGASMKGEFEQRLRSVIEDVQSSPKPIILFIDEVHTLVGAGGAAGTGDAANLLKPALARGTLRTMAATTWDEYKQYIEKDPALTRRFQVVQVLEPDEAKCVRMLRTAAGPFEKHHKVLLLDEALEAAVRLSNRYVPARQLPDKAVSLLDTAAARVAVSHEAVPAPVENARREIQSWETELNILARESAVGLDQNARSADLAAKVAAARTRLAELEDRWTKEKAAVAEILRLRKELQSGSVPAPDKESRLAALREMTAELQKLQGETPFVFPAVDAGAVADVVSDWTGIPVGRMMKSEISQVLQLGDTLERRVIGQRHALDAIARRIQTSRAGIAQPNRPIGVFMLVGPSGTGKTETALALAESLYGGEQSMITINMSEFKEAHTVSTLKGSPPGYVGFGKGGVLTEAVRRRPYSVVLLDEVEKAHRSVNEIFFQVFDKGWMEDAEGTYIDFKNTIIILTSNAAQDVVVNLCKDPELQPTPEGLEKALRGPLTQVFPDALLNRLVVVPFFPIGKDILERIIRLQLDRVRKRIEQNHNVPCTYDESVPALVLQRCNELERGARMVDALITNSILPEIGREMLSRLADGRRISRVQIGVQDGEFKLAFD